MQSTRRRCSCVGAGRTESGAVRADRSATKSAARADRCATGCEVASHTLSTETGFYET
jgi:hypothetical protein